MIEFLISRRPALANKGAGNFKVFDGNLKGVVRKCVDLKGRDEAMDRVWNRRHDCYSMGIEEYARGKAMAAEDPVDAFARNLEFLAQSLSALGG